MHKYLLIFFIRIIYYRANSNTIALCMNASYNTPRNSHKSPTRRVEQKHNGKYIALGAPSTPECCQLKNCANHAAVGNTALRLDSERAPIDLWHEVGILNLEVERSGCVLFSARALRPPCRGDVCGGCCQYSVFLCSNLQLHCSCAGNMSE